jgi:DNA-binding HxlR family transcriptional regulator
LLVIREALSGTTRFMDFSRALPKLARTILSARLQRLVDLGVIETIPVSQTSLYHEYVLTEMGRQLFPVVTALRQWGSDYLFEPSEPRHCLIDRRTRTTVAPLSVHSADGEAVLPEDTELVMRQPDGTNQ